MRMNVSDYKKYADSFSPKSKIVPNTIKAFIIGGIICMIGEGFIELYTYLGFSKEQSGTLECISLILLSAILTSMHVYDNIAKHADAGTLVPITGFANAIVSPAIEFRPEGMVLGVGAKIFSIAGPVITYGIIASIFSGVYYYIISLL